jgi:hypothetical protein
MRPGRRFLHRWKQVLIINEHFCECIARGLNLLVLCILYNIIIFGVLQSSNGRIIKDQALKAVGQGDILNFNGLGGTWRLISLVKCGNQAKQRVATSNKASVPPAASLLRPSQRPANHLKWKYDTVLHLQHWPEGWERERERERERETQRLLGSVCEANA